MSLENRGRRMKTLRLFWRRQSVLESGTLQSRPIRRSRLSMKPVVCLSAMPNSTCIVRKVCSRRRCNWVAYRAGPRARPPNLSRGQTRLSAARDASTLRCRPARSWSCRSRVGLLMQPSYHAGLTRGIPSPDLCKRAVMTAPPTGSTSVWILASHACNLSSALCIAA